MNFIQVKGYILTAYNHSFATAAKILGVHQQNLTVYMRNLEEELGVSLFSSNKRGTQLTVKGEELLPLFEQLDNTFGIIKDKCKNDRVLRIGVDNVFFQPYSFDYVQDFKRKYPDEKIEVVSSGRYSNLPVQLKKGEIDVYFGYYRDDLTDTLFHSLFEDTICIAYGNHKFDDKTSLSVKDLEGLDIFYDNEKLYKNKILLNALDKKHIRYNGVEEKNESVADYHIMNEDGVMIIHGSYLPTLPPKVKAIPIRGMKVPYGIYYRNNDMDAYSFIVRLLK